MPTWTSFTLYIGTSCHSSPYWTSTVPYLTKPKWGLKLTRGGGTQKRRAHNTWGPVTLATCAASRLSIAERPPHWHLSISSASPVPVSNCPSLHSHSMYCFLDCLSFESFEKIKKFSLLWSIPLPPRWVARHAARKTASSEGPGRRRRMPSF